MQERFEILCVPDIVDDNEAALAVQFPADLEHGVVLVRETRTLASQCGVDSLELGDD